MKNILKLIQEIRPILEGGRGSYPKILEPLAQEARKYSKFSDFERAFIIEIKHGLYWHITSDPNFDIDTKKGPRDMSSLAGGGATPGTLMVTSDLDHWADYYGKDRRYAALIDMSNVNPRDYYQVNRGFGNEFFVASQGTKKARVVKVYGIASAKSKDRVYNASIPQSEKELMDFYNKVHKKVEGFQERVLRPFSDVLLENVESFVEGFLKRNSRLRPHYKKLVKGVLYNPKSKGSEEAMWSNNRIVLTSKFFELVDKYGEDAGDWVFAHEMGHALSEYISMKDWLSKAEEVGIDVWDTPNLPWGVFNFEEAFAETYSVVVLGSDKRNQDWQRLVRWAIQEAGLRI